MTLELTMRLPSGREVKGHGILGSIHVLLERSREARAEAEWEIRLYEWILGQPNAEELASTYFKARCADAVLYLSKRDTVRALGWVIP